MVEVLVVLSVIGILAAVSIPLVLRVRVAGHEASAISSLRTIHDAQEVFRVACGHGKVFATSLPQLGAAQTISRDLSDAARVAKSGYVITMEGVQPIEAVDTCTGGPMAERWYAAAVPELPGVSGHRGFATAVGDDIWQDEKGAAPVEPFQPSATVSRVEIGK